MTQETIIKNMLTDTSQSQKKRARRKSYWALTRNRGDDTKTPINK